MTALRGFVAAATAAAAMILCAMPIAARAGDPADANVLAFGGSDMWRDGAFLYGGFIWSPAGLSTDGFTFKVLLDGGDYTYPSGGLGMNVNGTLLSASAMPGWRISRDGIVVSVFAGPVVENYRLTPKDPGSQLQGAYGGAQAEADLWYQPTVDTMLALDGIADTIGPMGSARAAVGWRLFSPAFVGPEAQGVWCANYRELRLGAHLTGWRFEAMEWSAGAGWARDSEGRAGPYLHVDLNVRY